MGRSWKTQAKIDAGKIKAKEDQEKKAWLKKRKKQRVNVDSVSKPKDLREVVNNKIDQQETAARAKNMIHNKPKKAIQAKKGVT